VTGGKRHEWQPEGIFAAALKFLSINPKSIARDIIFFKEDVELQRYTIREILCRCASPKTAIVALGNPDFLAAVKGETLAQLVVRYKKSHQEKHPDKICIIINESQCRVYHYSTIFGE